jgi:16S rRNA (cytosine967-C5)-methyltransferase
MQRKAVYNLLSRIEKGAYSQIILDSELKKHEDKAFASFITALFYGVIERRLTLDYIIDRLADSPPDSNTRILLRMALYQLMFMDSVPDSAAVNESVELAPKRSKGYINAILRNFLRKKGDFSLENADLSVKYSCPQWLIDKWTCEYGGEACLQILRTSLGKPPEFIVGHDAPGVPSGKSYVQDLSSQKACELLNPQENDIILDLCAAPGGKSFTIARLTNNTGRIISCDINSKKIELMDKTAKKLGLFTIETHVNNAKEFNPDFPLADKVLCDVPCSGLGVIRRKPEIKYKNPEDFAGLPEIQRQILEVSARYVKSGGYLMYSTCTLSRAENDSVADAFIAENSGFELIEKQTTIPSEDGGDGFFVALFKKN